MTQEQLYALECLIDATSLNSVLCGLVDICEEKAQHLAVNWQDHASATMWRMASHDINKTAAKVDF